MPKIIYLKSKDKVSFIEDLLKAELATLSHEWFGVANDSDD